MIQDVIGVALDFWLGSIELRPFPILLEFFREGIRVGKAMNVTACARIAVPVPGTARPVSGFEAFYAIASLAQPMKHVHAGKTGTNDNDIMLARTGQLTRLAIRRCVHDPCLLGFTQKR